MSTALQRVSSFRGGLAKAEKEEWCFCPSEGLRAVDKDVSQTQDKITT